MIFRNETKWDTKQLKKLVYQVVKEEGLDSKKTTVRVTSARSTARYVSGYAYIGKNVGFWHNNYGKISKLREWENKYAHGNHYIVMKVPTPRRGGFMLKDFIVVLIHEIHHALGLRHKDMLDNVKFPNYVDENIMVEQEKPKQKVKVDFVNVRYEKTKKKVAEQETKLLAFEKKYKTDIKRTTNLLKKYKKKLKYYNKKLGVEA